VVDVASSRQRHAVPAFIRALRPHQWVKNLLVFVPAIGAHRFSDATLLGPTLVAFACFCLAASGIYVANDVLDVAADRSHPRKRFRPIASGELSIAAARVLSAVCITSALAMGLLVLSPGFAAMVLLYVAGAAAYSLRFKREPVVDVFVLTGLYIVRVLAGGVATDIVVSTWLLAFAMFLFLSLAFLKRHAEILALAPDQQVTSRRRGYLAGDVSWLGSMGSTSGYLAVLVLALYLNSDDVTSLYRKPTVLFLICPLLLFWTGWMWLQAHRGQIHEDPIVASARDPASYIVAALVAVVLYAAL
jgi:4-hydroxybenzoate polyprenyltransferase